LCECFGISGGEFFDVVKVGLFIIIHHHIEGRKWLEEVLFNAASPTPHPFDDIRAHPELPCKDLHHYRGLGIGCGVEHETGGREKHL
jgi:hypothetical protein